MDTEDKSAGERARALKSRLSEVDSRVSLTVKMVLFTIFVGVVVWVLIDNVLIDKFDDIFHSRLAEELSEHAMEDRQRLDRYLASFEKTPGLIVSRKDFIEYAEQRTWSEGDTRQVKHYEKFPDWLPNRSALRVLSLPRYILLLDRTGRTREIFQWKGDKTPTALFALPNLVIAKSHDQALMTVLDGVPYLISSEPYYDPGGEVKAELLVCSPMDDEFMADALRPLPAHHIVALVATGEKSRVIASNDPARLPAGTEIGSLPDRYLVTGKEFFDYGAAEVQLKFYSFASRERISLLKELVISNERMERAVLALSLISVSALIMFFVSKRLQHITCLITGFSRDVLGAGTQKNRHGDQIHILKERFLCLTGEVIEARETIKKQAEEKTHMLYKEQLRVLISRLELVEEKERRRISDELHDNIGQNLAISKLKLETMLESSPGFTKELKEIRELIDQTIKFIRSLTFDMSPPVLYELGFDAAMEWLTEQFIEKYDLKITYIFEGTFTEPSGETGILLFRTIRELLMNIVKHSQSKQARLIISVNGNFMEINVEDNGVGFDPSDINNFSARTNSFGILSIRERIRHLKGTFEIRSKPDEGTRVKIVVPLWRVQVHAPGKFRF